VSFVRGETLTGENAVRLGNNPDPDRLPAWKEGFKTRARTKPPDMGKIMEIFAGYMYKSVSIGRSGQDELFHNNQTRSRR
jgi:hypothetical protein